MHLSTLLITALSATTLTIALPTTNTTDPFAYHEDLESGIEKRGTYGWVTNYAMTGDLHPNTHSLEPTDKPS